METRGTGWRTLLALTLIGVGLRVWYLDQPMRSAESETVLVYLAEEQPPLSALWRYHAPNNHVLNTLLMRLCAAVLGSAPWVLRLPAFVAGCLCIPAAFLAARAVWDDPAGAWAAALVASSPYAVLLSAQARGYTLVALCSLLAVWLTTRVRAGAPGAWIALGAVGAVGLFAVPVMLLPLLAVAGWGAADAWLAGRGREALWLGAALGLAGLLGLVAYAPLLASVGVGPLVHNPYVQPLAWADFPGHLGLRLERLWGAGTAGLPVAAQVVLMLAAVRAMLTGRQREGLRVPLVPVALVLLALMLAVGRVAPYARVFLPFWLLLLMAAGVGLASWMGWVVRRLGLGPGTVGHLALATCMLGASCVLTSGAPGARIDGEMSGGLADGPALATYLEAHASDGDVVLVHWEDLALGYYWKRAGSPRQLMFRPGPGRAWLVAGPGNGPQRILQARGVVLTDPDSLTRVATVGESAVYRCSGVRPPER